MSFFFIRTSCTASRLHKRLGKVQLRRASSGHESQYNEPGGYLFGERVSTAYLNFTFVQD